MNELPVPEGHPADEPLPVRVFLSSLIDPSVPRQTRRSATRSAAGTGTSGKAPSGNGVPGKGAPGSTLPGSSVPGEPFEGGARPPGRGGVSTKDKEPAGPDGTSTQEPEPARATAPEQGKDSEHGEDSECERDSECGAGERRSTAAAPVSLPLSTATDAAQKIRSALASAGSPGADAARQEGVTSPTREAGTIGAVKPPTEESSIASNGALGAETSPAPSVAPPDGRSHAAAHPRGRTPAVTDTHAVNPHNPHSPTSTTRTPHDPTAPSPLTPNSTAYDTAAYDPMAYADAATMENLLRCWVRESGTPRPAGPSLRLTMNASGTTLLVPVHYWSATGWHRFGAPVLESAPDTAPPLDAVTLAALLRREGSFRPAAESAAKPVPASGARSATRVSPEASAPPAAFSESVAPTNATATEPAALAAPAVPAASADTEPPPAEGDAAELVGRVADSVRRTAAFLAHRRTRPADDCGSPFLAAEQSLILGHPLHPTPKSREGLSDAEAGLYSPELRGRFPLHWMAVDRSVLTTDSAWTARGRTVAADRLVVDLAEDDLEPPHDTVPLPLHPWQARELRHRPGVAELLDAGLLHDLGPRGPVWHPTSSVRTVFRPDAEAMLKLSLGLRITNSRRENLRKELERGVEVHRLLRTGLADQWRAAFPSADDASRATGFDIVRDPAWLALTGADGEALPGFDVVIRHNPFGPYDDAVCIAGLTSPRPWPDRAGLRSRLADLVATLTRRTGRTGGAVAAEWFLRYLETVVRPILWLDGTAGVALEAHQQNTLVLLDADGWPVGGRYRDNQGYYFRESRRAELDARLPGIGTGSDTFVSDAVADERFAYYLAINNVLGLIGAFGAQRLAGEEVLLAAFRRFLADAATAPREHRSPLAQQLLETRTLRCKANLLTRLQGLDELVGPVDTQSVYITITNPLSSSVV